MTSLYIHIPFCQKKCNYCAFTSYENAQNYFEQYFDALKIELEHKTKSKKLRTIYIGGGTPSLIPIELYKKLSFNFEKDYEFTLEVNPKTVNKKYLQELKSIGVNRLSIGIQSFDNDILKNIGRIHNANEAKQCVQIAKEVGFKNISIDLIYGLPNQTMKVWQDTLKQATGLEIQHISAYGLKIEYDTPFGKTPPSNLPNDDTCADMYLTTIEILEQNGFSQYEISNFAQKGYKSNHNTTYWKNNPYIACGVSAHGYENKIRYENTTNIKEYIKNPFLSKQTPLSENDILEEGIFLGLRMIEGIDIQKFNQRYNINFEEKYAHILDKYKEFFITTENIALTKEGLLLSNNILSEFIS